MAAGCKCDNLVACFANQQVMVAKRKQSALTLNSLCSPYILKTRRETQEILKKWSDELQVFADFIKYLCSRYIFIHMYIMY